MVPMLERVTMELSEWREIEREANSIFINMQTAVRCLSVL
jgi:hypothetical protein